MTKELCLTLHPPTTLCLRHTINSTRQWQHCTTEVGAIYGKRKLQFYAGGTKIPEWRGIGLPHRFVNSVFSDAGVGKSLTCSGVWSLLFCSGSTSGFFISGALRVVSQWLVFASPADVPSLHLGFPLQLPGSLRPDVRRLPRPESVHLPRLHRPLLSFSGHGAAAWPWAQQPRTLPLHLCSNIHLILFLQERLGRAQGFRQ